MDSDSFSDPVGGWQDYFEEDKAVVIHSITFKFRMLITSGWDLSILAEVPFSLVGWYPCDSGYWMLNVLTNHPHFPYEYTAYQNYY